MATIKKISQLTQKDSPSRADYMILEDATSSKHHSVALSSLSKAHDHGKDLGTVTLVAANWDDNTLSQTVTATGVVNYSSVHIGAILVVPVSKRDADIWCDHGIYLDRSELRENTLRFTCLTKPTESISVAIRYVG